MDPNTGEEDAKHWLVVRKARLNWAYDASVRLVGRPNLDEGKEKHARVPEVNGVGMITVVPLRAFGPSRAREDVAGRPAKRVAQGTPEWVKRARSNSPSSGGCGASHAESVAAKTGETIAPRCNFMTGVPMTPGLHLLPRRCPLVRIVSFFVVS